MFFLLGLGSLLQRPISPVSEVVTIQAYATLLTREVNSRDNQWESKLGLGDSCGQKLTEQRTRSDPGRRHFILNLMNV